ncbi:MAG: MoaD/ThiS family protein [Hyphomonas sp.]|nr:MoaD/ThiS family protein [Hyphomonas sp.]
MVEILYFGRLMDVMGCSQERIALPDSVRDTDGLRRWLDAERILSGALLEPTVRIAVNDAIVPEPFAVSDGDSIAFLPPVGGG